MRGGSVRMTVHPLPLGNVIEYDWNNKAEGVSLGSCKDANQRQPQCVWWCVSHQSPLQPTWPYTCSALLQIRRWPLHCFRNHILYLLESLIIWKIANCFFHNCLCFILLFICLFVLSNITISKTLFLGFIVCLVLLLSAVWPWENLSLVGFEPWIFPHKLSAPYCDRSGVFSKWGLAELGHQVGRGLKVPACASCFLSAALGRSLFLMLLWL